MAKNTDIGTKYELLTIIGPAESRNGKRYWRCKCDCGNETEIPTGKLGVTKSCGCLNHKQKYEDLKGQIFEYLTVLEYNGKDNSNKVLWKCKCNCGNETIVRANDLKNKKILSCGCLGKERKKEGYLKYIKEKKEHPSYYNNLINQVFGKLTVLEFDEKTTIEKRTENNKKSYWLCKCECGNQISVVSTSLLNGSTKSCGCLRSEVASENIKKIQPLATQRLTDNLIGQTFGKLKVLSLNTELSGKGKKSFWNCLCDCGTECIVRGYSLKNGHTQSCGCIKNSIGEKNIENLLQMYNFKYKKEYTFQDLKDKNLLRYDFAIFNELNEFFYLIEFDGIQHFKPVTFGGITKEKAEENFIQTIERDKIKNNYAKMNNISLIRIPYWERDDLDIEDLLLETSNYLI